MKEVNRLIEMGVLQKINNFKLSHLTSIVPKKNSTVRFISNFRELHNTIKTKSFPISKIQDILRKVRPRIST